MRIVGAEDQVEMQGEEDIEPESQDQVRVFSKEEWNDEGLLDMAEIEGIQYIPNGL